MFDLETNTDHDEPAKNDIIEIGACVLRNGAIGDEFSTLVQPHGPLTDHAVDLTGLRDGDLADAPGVHDALTEFLAFVDGRPLVAHNGFGFDFLVLDETLRRLERPVVDLLRLDSLELAHLVAPRAGRESLPDISGSQPPASRRLGDLARWLSLSDEPQQHRALSDARLAARVVIELLGRLNRDAPTTILQRWLLAAGGHPWAGWLHPVADPPSLLAVVPPPRREPEAQAPSMRFDPHEAVAPLGADGALATSEGRRFRPQQLRMAEAVAAALARDERRMVEAPTGTGKTLAYLVPALAYARANGAPVVVATHSKVLQNQILTSLVDMERVLGKLRWVLLKGTQNYVSLDDLEGAIESLSAGDPDPLEALGLAVIVGWVASTPTGDWDDLDAWILDTRIPGFASLRWRLSVESDPGIATSELDERCFHRRAIEGLELADIAVLNHAVLLSRSDVAEAVDQLIVDEAHNLEESATNALTEQVDGDAVTRLLRSIHDPARRRGTIHRYLDATGTKRDDERIDAVLDLVESCRSAADDLGPRLIDYVRSRTPVHRDDVERYGAAYRIREGIDTPRPDYQVVRRSALELCRRLVELATALDQLDVPEQLRGRYRRRRLEAEIARMGRTARAHSALVAAATGGTEPDEVVNLVELRVDGGEWSWSLRRVPIDVSAALGDVWDSMSSVVLTSATLSVAGTMEHLVRRLGLGHAVPVQLDSPFRQLTEQSLLVLPDHLPTPRGGLMDEFIVAEADEIARLFTLTGGRAMALFTSQARMRHAADHVRAALRGVVEVLCQGEEPSPVIVDRMRNEVATSLLATRSFWEGIDVPGEALSLLVIEKLPFASPGDPIVAARMEHLEAHGHDPFSEYLVPEAVLRFVQGMGRLIRTETDVGAAVLLDRRLRRPVPYRETFLESLPGPPTLLRPNTPDEGYHRIARHLGIELTDDLLSKLAALPTADPWDDLAQLAITDDEAGDPTVVRARLEAVRERLGFAAWRPGQLEVMIDFIAGRDALAVLPTGSGKSLTYQLPALLRPGLTVVISPLVALMRDQVASLRARGISSVAAISSGQAQSEQDEILARARHGAYRLLYVSPERLWSQRFRSALAEVDVARVAVDEAHCIAQWGHTFRPEYSVIPAAVEAIGRSQRRPAVLAATATATPTVQKEIIANLDLRLSGPPHTANPDRPELRYYVERCVDHDDREVRVAQVLETFRGQPAIVYVPRRIDTERVAALLRSDNHVARPYHGGMEAAQRVFVEEAFQHGEIDVVVATKAFGLGIDKPDIHVVIHLEMPASIEEYIQETGRAARGAVEGVGPPHGTCVLLVAPRDCRIHDAFVRSAAPDANLVRQLWDDLEGRELYATTEQLAASLSRPRDGLDDIELAVHYLVRSGAVRRLEDVTWQGRVRVPRDAQQVYDAAVADGATFPPHTATLLRHCVTRGSSDFHLMVWSERLGLDPAVLERSLLELHRRDVIGFSGWEHALHLVADSALRPDWRRIESDADERRRAVRDLSRHAKEFARNDSSCRRARLLRYLGADADDQCDGCDVCRPDLPRPWAASTLTADQLRPSVPTSTVIVELVRSVQWAEYSRRNLERCLLGHADGDYPLPNQLRLHPQFGALRSLRSRELVSAIDALVADGRLIEVERTAEGRGPWMTLQVPNGTNRHEEGA